MNISANISKHLLEVHFGGNWTASNMKDQLLDVSWDEAKTQVHGLNNIATLTYHIHYYVEIATKVLEGGPVEGNDVPITSMARGIEIDIRQMLEETDLPEPMKPVGDFKILY
ncbi:MAG: hypothetical protein HN542_05910 [Flavobacteriales bacterium]|jgi:hypothetical protein|nr:hypothetical protein [Flavobacteriales bacterium]NCG30980.1 hypothetical protein [Bacteroidota bacterium]MBT4705186.1 hypothetical protein [Flavobacteriales bacterium]MBT4930398.1 hypothetical protein [Flavobacteriales bacterium]MBT5132621.1 hypothetical protein [Flavobacteriales bacterium]